MKLTRKSVTQLEWIFHYFLSLIIIALIKLRYVLPWFLCFRYWLKDTETYKKNLILITQIKWCLNHVKVIRMCIPLRDTEPMNAELHLDTLRDSCKHEFSEPGITIFNLKHFCCIINRILFVCKACLQV